MSFVEATEQASPLRRVTYRFWYDDRIHTLVLDTCVVEARPTTRHKFRKMNDSWSRLNRRDSGIKLIVPEQVLQFVREQFVSALKVTA